jgi:ComF family protein
MVDKWSLHRLILPPVCLLCDAVVAPTNGDMDICQDCRAELDYVTGARCRCCAVPLASAAGEPVRLCGRCLRRSPAYDAVVPVFNYDGPVARLIQGLKFNGRLSHARLLGQLMGSYLRGRIDARPDVLLPVPLHWRRLRQRGFNQSQELARYISRIVDRRLMPDACVRRRDTTAQADLPARQRRRNVHEAFACRSGGLPRHVAIVDDVLTTGSTAHELARVLKRHGVARVDVWVCARAAS